MNINRSIVTTIVRLFMHMTEKWIWTRASW